MKTTGRIATLLLLLGLLIAVTTGCDRQSASSTSEDRQKPARKLSARELITERAKMRHGSDARIRVDGGFYGGTYQVEVLAPVKSGMYAGGFDHYIYTAAADEKTQRVTIWELTWHNE